jgi:hypothetical protein
MTEPTQRLRPKKPKAPATLGNTFVVIFGIAALIAVGGVSLILLIPTFAGVAQDGFVQAATVKVGSAPPYNNGSNIKLTDDFTKAFEATKPEILQIWKQSVGLTPNEATVYGPRVIYNFGAISTSDDVNKVNLFYQSELEKLGFKRFLNEPAGSTVQRLGYASTPKREIVLVTFYRPGSPALSFFTNKGVNLPKDRNILYLTSASY